MTIKSGFFNSSGGDRKYDALDISSLFDGVITDGVFETLGNIFAVTPGTGMQVVVDTGKAWFNHTWTVNDAKYPLSVDPADVTLDRIDAVVLEVNNSDAVRNNDIKIVKGTPASTPAKPTLTRSDEINQYALAYVTITHGASDIKAYNIEMMVGREDCPFVTGLIETVPIDALFAQWESEFDEWFQNVKTTLEGDVAANLQRQITEIVDEQENRGVYYKKMAPYDQLETKSGETIKIPEGWKIGDVRLTNAKSIGPDWALCNGDQISEVEYPEYIEKFFEEASINTGSAVTVDITTQATSDYKLATNIVEIGENSRFLYWDKNSNAYCVERNSYGEWTSTAVVGLNGVTPQRSSWVYAPGPKIVYISGRYILLGCTDARISDNTTRSITLHQTSDMKTWTPLTISVDPWTNTGTYSKSKVIYDMVESPSGQICAYTQSLVTDAWCHVFLADGIDSVFVCLEKSKTGHYKEEYKMPGPTLVCIDGDFFLAHLISSSYLNFRVDKITKDGEFVVGSPVNSPVSFAGYCPIGPVHKIESDKPYRITAFGGLLESYDGLTNWNPVVPARTWYSTAAQEYPVVASKKIRYKNSDLDVDIIYSSESSGMALTIVDYTSGTAIATRQDFSPDIQNKSPVSAECTSRGFILVYGSNEAPPSVVEYNGLLACTLPEISIGVNAFIRVKET